MRRVCFVGNSHLAAIKLGWDDTKAHYADFAATFFGIRGPNAQSLTARKGVLFLDDETLRDQVFSTSETGHTVNIAGHDAVVVCGIGITAIKLLRLYSEYRSDAHHAAAEAKYIVSRNCFAEACRGLIESTKAIQLARQIVDDVHKPVWVVPEPLPSREIIASRRFAFIKEAVDAKDEESLGRSYEEALHSLTNEWLHFVTQPAETRSGGFFSDPRFSAGSTRLVGDLSVEHSAKDSVHMNREYGALLLKTLMPQIEARFRG